MLGLFYYSAHIVISIMQLSNEIFEEAKELSPSIFNPEMAEVDSSETSVLTTTTNSVLSLLTPPWEPHPSPNFQTCLLLFSYSCFEYFFPSAVFWYLSRNRRKIHTEFWYEILKVRDNLNDLDVDVSIKLKLILIK
jgi:hypothetical protein